jgi:hypothetical protein
LDLVHSDLHTQLGLHPHLQHHPHHGTYQPVTVYRDDDEPPGNMHELSLTLQRSHSVGGVHSAVAGQHMDLRQMNKIVLGGSMEQEKLDQGVEFLLNIAEAKIRTGTPLDSSESFMEKPFSAAELRANDAELERTLQKEREIVFLLAGTYYILLPSGGAPTHLLNFF